MGVFDNAYKLLLDCRAYNYKPVRWVMGDDTWKTLRCEQRRMDFVMNSRDYKFEMLGYPIKIVVEGDFLELHTKENVTLCYRKPQQ